MLFDYTYFLKEFDAGFFNDKADQENEFIIPLNGAITEKKSDFFKTLINSRNRFCFYIPLELTQHSNEYIKDEIIHNIVRLLFLPNYIRVKGKYVFFIEKAKDEDKSPDILKNEFYIELKKQGIDDLIIEILQLEPPFTNLLNGKGISMVYPELNNYLSNSNPDGYWETFTKAFAFPVNFQKWIVPVTNTDNLHNKIRLIEKFENWLKLSNPLYVQLIEMCKLAHKDGAVLEAENKLLKFKLETHTYSLKLLRSESIGFVNEVSSLRNEVDRLARQINNPGSELLMQASPAPVENDEVILQLRTQVDTEHKRGNAILDWYKKEYEVLPNWYKKFGHIIKVFIGKRTFKSLFK